jgi:hypothetical protein
MYSNYTKEYTYLNRAHRLMDIDPFSKNNINLVKGINVIKSRLENVISKLEVFSGKACLNDIVIVDFINKNDTNSLSELYLASLTKNVLHNKLLIQRMYLFCVEVFFFVSASPEQFEDYVKTVNVKSKLSLQNIFVACVQDKYLLDEKINNNNNSNLEAYNKLKSYDIYKALYSLIDKCESMWGDYKNGKLLPLFLESDPQIELEKIICKMFCDKMEEVCKSGILEFYDFEYVTNSKHSTKDSFKNKLADFGKSIIKEIFVFLISTHNSGFESEHIINDQLVHNDSFNRIGLQKAIVVSNYFICMKEFKIFEIIDMQVLTNEYGDYLQFKLLSQSNQKSVFNYVASNYAKYIVH